jgi:ankyrin repeat protein
MGWTPLHLAAREGHLEVVKLLVEHGADLTATTQAIAESTGAAPGAPPADPTRPPEPTRTYPAIPRRTPLDWALAMDRAEVVQYLRSLKK